MFLRTWTVERDTGSPRPTMIWEVSGWDDFMMANGLEPYQDLHGLGFLTEAGVLAVRNACGEDYTTADLFLDVCARGPHWLPSMVLGVQHTDQLVVANTVYDMFRSKFNAMIMVE
jgi:hypothetical protein